MIIKRIVILFVVLHFSISTYSQNAENNLIVNKSNELGMHSGFTTGVGLSFRHWEGKYGGQITAIPLKGDYFQFISVGITGLYSLNNNRWYRHFLYFGNHIIINEHDYYWEDEPTKNTKYNAGIGYGIELGRKVRFSFMFGYGGYNLLSRNYKLLPTGEMGLFFKLNAQ